MDIHRYDKLERRSTLIGQSQITASGNLISAKQHHPSHQATAVTWNCIRFVVWFIYFGILFPLKNFLIET